MSRVLTALIVASGLAASAAIADEHGAPHPAWSYSGPGGPNHWQNVADAFSLCGTGRHQSPIDIVSAVKAPLPVIEFHYSPTPLRIIDTGHSIQVDYAPGSTITVNGETFELKQFHFHEPSEERFHGHSFPMVAHLVHQNAHGELAVVAVLFERGKANAFLAPIWKHFPTDKNTLHPIADTSVNLADVLPASRGYYTFPGSLTTPPCSEGVTWFVLKTPVEMSEQQIKLIDDRYPDNARPVQPLNDRVVRETLD